MAKVKFGMMMTDASGKLGGHVFAKNRGGSYVRTKGIPSNPQTSSQMGIRGIFASISTRWAQLTEAQRNSFRNFVNDYATTDIFGDLRNPSGKSLFQRLNQNLAISGQAQIDVCSSPQEVPFANLDTADGSAIATELNVTYTGDLTGSQVVFWATPAMSQGKKFVKNDLRQISVVAGDAGDTVDIGAAWAARFGTLTAGANIYVGIRVINANGQASPLETVKADISA